jgi:hypothetical protein
LPKSEQNSVTIADLEQKQITVLIAGNMLSKSKFLSWIKF